MPYICVPHTGQNTRIRLLPLAAVFAYRVTSPVMWKSESGTRMVVRNALPEIAWQSVQWHTLAFSGSTVAS